MTPIEARRERDRARYRARQAAKGKAVGPSRNPRPQPKPNHVMTPSKHVAKRGPAGTAQEPDLSRAVVTVYQPPPSRYAVPASEFVGTFTALGPGRYLNTEILKG